MRNVVQVLLAAIVWIPVATGMTAAAQAAELKVLRVPFLIAETNFDPAFTSDLYSNTVIEEILESPLTYDFLARPAKLKPLTLEAMPEITDGGRTYTLHVKPGIYFTDDPAFGGKKRELVAADYEFAMKRLMDPKGASPNLWLLIDGPRGCWRRRGGRQRRRRPATLPTMTSAVARDSKWSRTATRCACTS